MMGIEELSQAELARKLDYSRARITQMLNLLKLPDELIVEVEEMGDYWSRQLLTERQLRRLSIMNSHEYVLMMNIQGIE